MRNENVLDKNSLNPICVYNNILNFVQVCSKTFGGQKSMSICSSYLVLWSKLPRGFLKVNTNGSSLGKARKAIIG